MLYKDEAKLNHRNKKEYSKNLKELGEFVRKAEKNSDGKPLLQEQLLGNVKKSKKTHPEHNHCDFPRKNYKSDRITEKRICRCMKYYGQDKELCRGCGLNKKWNNAGELRITDYEVPMEYVIPKVGGIDLLIDDKYAAEMKPEESSETLVRMFAEILTYTIDSNYSPAICFFENSKQMEDFQRFRREQNEDLELLMKYVDVFYISYDYDEKTRVANYKIKPTEEYEDNDGNGC